MSKPIIKTGVLTKFGEKDANGNVYPKGSVIFPEKFLVFKDATTSFNNRLSEAIGVGEVLEDDGETVKTKVLIHDEDTIKDIKKGALPTYVSCSYQGQCSEDNPNIIKDARMIATFLSDNHTVEGIKPIKEWDDE